MNPTDSLGMDPGIQMTHGTSAADVLAWFWVNMVIIIFYLGIWIFYSYCYYVLSKKMNLKYSWMAFIPFLQYFNILFIAGKTLWWFWKNMLLPAIALVSWWFLLSFTVSEYFIPVTIIGYIWLIVSYIRVKHGISVRTGHGKWWTVGLLFWSWIIVPVTAFHYEPGDELNPRPFSGWRKWVLIILSWFFVFLIPLGILAAVLFPAMTWYLQASRDSARLSHSYSIRTWLEAYFADHEKYPDTDPSWCIPIDQMEWYIYGNVTDPLPERLMDGCDGSNGQSYAYRKYTDADWREQYVIGMKMERRDNRNGNSNEWIIDNINSGTSLVKGIWPYFYITE